jgi:hypothetical protein
MSNALWLWRCDSLVVPDWVACELSEQVVENPEYQDSAPNGTFRRAVKSLFEGSPQVFQFEVGKDNGEGHGGSRCYELVKPRLN